jgi:hypothetical protein
MKFNQDVINRLQFFHPNFDYDYDYQFSKISDYNYDYDYLPQSFFIMIKLRLQDHKFS